MQKDNEIKVKFEKFKKDFLEKQFFFQKSNLNRIEEQIKQKLNNQFKYPEKIFK